MRSTFTGLNTMVRGILANQLSLDVTGHNITNAGTEGYSRQMVNLTATQGQHQPTSHGDVMVGTGVEGLSVQRARDLYADIQFRNESSTKNYYETRATNYDKLEVIFDDSEDTGIQNAMQKFYQSWVDLSKESSESSERSTVIEQGKILSDRIQTAAPDFRNRLTPNTTKSE